MRLRRRDALATLRQSPPAVLLVDLMMPRMNGWELLARPEAAGIPTLVITALALSPGDRRLLRAPVLQKPLYLPDLLAWLDQHLSGSRHP